jgi:hypothetical protein
MTSEIYVFAFVVTLGMIVFVISYLRDRDWEREQQFIEHRKDVIRTIIQEAQKHKETFELKLYAEKDGSNSLLGVMRHYDRYRIEIEVFTPIDTRLEGTGINVHFSLKGPHGPIFYKFDSTILSIHNLTNLNRFHIGIVPPHDLKVAQKRGFIRVTPSREMIRVIAIWPMDDDSPIPKKIADLGRPAIYYRRGMKESHVNVENISASGIALRIPTQGNPTTLNPIKGSEMLALIVYEHEKKCKQVVTFWCTCIVTNVRPVPSFNQYIVLGMQFMKWTVTKPGNKQLNWFRTSPMIGISPITQWVTHISRHQQRPTRM